MYCDRLHAWWSTNWWSIKSWLATLLSSLIAHWLVGWGLLLCLWFGPTGFKFCSSIQLYVLLSPYLCFISFLYHDVYVLGDNTSISEGSCMQTKHLCVLIHIRIKGGLVLLNMFKPSCILLTVPRRASFMDTFCYLGFVFVIVILSCLFLAAL